MSCWDVLGIEPTGDTARIREAYEQQLKFASPEEVARLEQAYREATGQSAPAATPARAGTETPAGSDGAELDAREAQVAREVVIQIRALLNDDVRSQDVAIWRAILCEPPADKPALRRAIAARLEGLVRPMAENGALPPPVAGFLGDWFEWYGLRESAQAHDRAYPDAEPAGR